MSKIMRALEEEARRSQEGGEPLRRYSIEKDDPGRENYDEARARLGWNCTVYLDGVKVDCVITADEVQGIVVLYEQPPRAASSNRLATVERHGEVRVRWGRP